jgi:hypothetical protein
VEGDALRFQFATAKRYVKTYLAMLNDFPEACLQEPPRI